MGPGAAPGQLSGAHEDVCQEKVKSYCEEEMTEERDDLPTLTKKKKKEKKNLQISRNYHFPDDCLLFLILGAADLHVYC